MPKERNILPKYFWIHNRTTLVFIIIYSLVMYEPFRRLAKLTIDFGGTKGIWKDTVMTSIYGWEYGNQYFFFELLLQTLIVATIVGALCFSIYVLLNRKKDIWKSNFMLLYTHGVFFGIVIQCIVLHHIKGTPYLTDRMAIFLVPLFLLSFIFFNRSDKI